jgi:dGTPase
MASFDRYSPLQSLGFYNRSPTEQKKALLRPTVPKDSPEYKDIEATAHKDDSPFMQDKRAITRNPLYHRLSRLGQLAPTVSHGFQNRMTHTEHAAQIADTLCHRMHLGRNSALLAQSIVYGHDIGHGPFSHRAEVLFNQRLKANGCDGKWDHDMFGLRILTEFAHAGLSYQGLPLTAATLEGVTKRFKRYHNAPKHPDNLNRSMHDLPETIRNIERQTGALHLNQWSAVEGQVASIADWLAFTVSDLRDLLMLKLHEQPFMIEPYFSEIAKAFPPAQQAWDEVKRQHPRNSSHTRRLKQNHYAYMQTLIGMFADKLEQQLVEDVLDATLENYLAAHAAGKIHCAEDVRDLEELTVGFSPPMRNHLQSLRTYMFAKVFAKIYSADYANIDGGIARFFTLIENAFASSPDSAKTTPLTIDASWLARYHEIEADPARDAQQKTCDKLMHIAAYITCNCTDQDVLYALRHHDPEFYKTFHEERLMGVYPSHPLSDFRTRVKRQAPTSKIAASMA